MSPPGDHCFRGCRILPLPVLLLGAANPCLRRSVMPSPGGRCLEGADEGAPVHCLSSPVNPVPRPKVGDPMGAEPPWSLGRESRGNRLEIGSLWRFLFPISLPLKEMGSPAGERLPSKPTSPPQRAILQAPADSPLASAIHDPVPSPPAAYFLGVEKVGKDMPKGTASSHG